MNNVYHEYIDVWVVVYLDDVVIYCQTLEDQLYHMRLALSRLREHQLYVKLKKCEFA